MFVNFQIAECRKEKNEFFEPINSQITCQALFCFITKQNFHSSSK